MLIAFLLTAIGTHFVFGSKAGRSWPNRWLKRRESDVASSWNQSLIQDRIHREAMAEFDATLEREE
jgi:hypothetical protein